MTQELDTVVLARDLDENGLRAGDVGVVVHSYAGGSLFEVEFVASDGTTIALLTLTAQDIRPLESGEVLILHAHPVAQV
jgi:hypothetical protein